MGDMDHSDVRELLEDAAIEPGGLERLMAGDTPSAAIVAGHVAGCPDCAEELDRLRRSVEMIRPALRAMPSPELRTRTLAYVAALGRDRSAATEVRARDASAVGAGDVAAARARADDPIVAIRSAAGGWNRLAALAAIAAALILAVVGTALVIDRRHADTDRIQSAEIDALGDVARWTLKVDSLADVRRVRLAATSGGGASGSLLYSPSSTELVMVADGLSPVAAGQEYGCWIEVDGKRTRIGRMIFGGDLAYWVGDVDEFAILPAHATFGVSLVTGTTPDAAGEPVLVGTS